MVPAVDHLARLDNHVLCHLMRLLTVPDLLRLSATCTRLRSDLFCLMHGELAVQLSITLRNWHRSYVQADGQRGLANAASFSAFLAAGGAALIKSLELSVIAHNVYMHKLAWPPVPALESLTISWSLDSAYDDGEDFVVQLSDCPIIATASQLRSLQLCNPLSGFTLGFALDCISSAAALGGNTLTDITIQVCRGNNMNP